MAYIPRSSFNQSPGVIPMQVKKKHTIRIVSLLGTTFMVLALIATAGVFFYKDYLEGQLANTQAALDSKSDSNNEQKITEIETYDRKLRIAHNLLDNHIAASHIFGELESLTKQTVRFTSFEYLYDPGFEAEISLTGDTRELESVMLQKMQIFKDDLFSDFVVRDISTAPLFTGEETENKNQNTNNDKKEVSKLGVGFQVVGIFNKEPLEYTGKSVTNTAPVSVFSESPDVVPTPDTSTTSISESSSNDESI